MRVARYSIIITALSAFILAIAPDSWACSCAASGPPCQSAFQADAIFVGTVASITALPDDDLPLLRPGEARIPRTLHVEFADVQPYRGLQSTTATVFTAGSGPSCGYAFKTGERYLVYATRQAGGTGLVTGICSRTRRIGDAGEDLRFLQTLSQPTPAGARVYGTITHWERDLL